MRVTPWGGLFVVDDPRARCYHQFTMATTGQFGARNTAEAANPESDHDLAEANAANTQEGQTPPELRRATMSELPESPRVESVHLSSPSFPGNLQIVEASPYDAVQFFKDHWQVVAPVATIAGAAIGTAINVLRHRREVAATQREHERAAAAERLARELANQQRFN